MSHENLKQRTRLFALSLIRQVKLLPDDKVSGTPGTQRLRSPTSVAANYRPAKRACFTAGFIAKRGIVEAEADESAFWLDLLTETGITSTVPPEAPVQEASELTAIAVASIHTARAKGSGKPARRATAPRSPLPAPRS